MNSCVIIGATSMIGVALIKQCIARNVHVFAFVRRNSLHIKRLPKSPLVTVVHCNLNEIKQLDISTIKNKPDCFYHIGWSYTDKTGRNDVSKQLLNIQYSIDAVHLAKKIGCTKFIGAGSQAEYGIASVPLNESVPCNPLVPYGIAKYASGKLCKLECKKLGLEFNWVRVLSVYGINDNEGTLIKTLIEKMKADEPMPLSPCTHIWDYLFEDDAGSAFWAVGEKGVNGKTYCLGSGVGMPLKDYIEILKSQINSSYQPCYGEVPYNENSIQYLIADISELTKDTEWKPKIEFRDGIKKVIGSFRIKEYIVSGVREISN